MPQIGFISIGMGADSEKLARDLNKSKASVSGFGKSFDMLKVNVGAAAAAIGGMVAAAVSIDKVKQALEGIDSTAKLADRIGASTEALAALQYQAGLAGAEQATLSKSLEKLSVNLVNAAQGSGPAVDALKQLGLNAGELATGERVAVFGKIADALNTIENPAERAALAVEIFGKGGAALGNLLAEGSEGIKKARAEADELGLTFSRLEAARVEEANDAMSRLGKAFEGIAVSGAIVLAPALEAISNGLRTVVTWGRQAFEWLKSFTIFGGEESGIGAASLQMESFADVTEQAKDAQDELFDSMKRGWEASDRAFEGFMEDFQTKFAENDAFQEGNQALDAMAKRFIEAGRTQEEQIQAEVERLVALRDRGFLSQDQFRRGVDDLGGRFGGRGGGGAQFAGAAFAGSVEARETLLRHQFAGTDPVRELVRNTVRQVESQERAEARLDTLPEDLADALSKLMGQTVF